MQAMHRGLATLFRPDDIYIANLVGALNQINNGATTLVDWCHNNPTPEHTDAAIRGLEDAGIRALFLHGSPKPDPGPAKAFQRSADATRRSRAIPQGPVRQPRRADHLRPRNSRAVLFDLRCDAADLELAREFDLLASMHVGGGTRACRTDSNACSTSDLVDRPSHDRARQRIAPETVRRIADRGGTFTVTAEIELQMGYGDPLTGILHEKKSPISVGTDVEPAVGSDLFTCMRLTLQHERNRGIIEALEQDR